MRCELVLEYTTENPNVSHMAIHVLTDELYINNRINRI